MFYPCIYLFAIWDAYHDADQNKTPLLFLPFTLSAYTGTIRVIFSNNFTINDIFQNPGFLIKTKNPPSQAGSTFVMVSHPRLERGTP